MTAHNTGHRTHEMIYGGLVFGRLVGVAHLERQLAVFGFMLVVLGV